eukprot:TRINITY_DN144_c1_g1_i3.p2 TRINITY_DN144_c1_g1~~TRINITY_DN144_c1_g1_i3.p2  ORF type:complete len:291 (-),score=62.48 TRINITY_DN144_c1_g1_i3:267-1097(-)
MSPQQQQALQQQQAFQQQQWAQQFPGQQGFPTFPGGPIFPRVAPAVGPLLPGQVRLPARLPAVVRQLMPPQPGQPTPPPPGQQGPPLPGQQGLPLPGQQGPLLPGQQTPPRPGQQMPQLGMPAQGVPFQQLPGQVVPGQLMPGQLLPPRPPAGPQQPATLGPLRPGWGLAPPGSQTVAQMLAGAGDFGILFAAFQTAGMLGPLANAGGGTTVFAPTNAAFVQLAIALGFPASQANGQAAWAFLLNTFTVLGGGTRCPSSCASSTTTCCLGCSAPPS